MSTTHTYAICPVSRSTYYEIGRKLMNSGYGDQFHKDDSGEVIDLHGIAIRSEGKACEHPAERIAANILEGDAGAFGVQWCRDCGAYRRTGDSWIGEWREPETDK